MPDRNTLTIDQINRIQFDEFVDYLGEIAEDSPWVARKAARLRPFVSRQDLIRAFITAVQTAGKMQQSALIAAHPELAVGNLAERIKPVGETSKSEQAGAGLDRLSQALLQQFLERNAAYRKRFGFPYILAIKGMGPAQILADFDRRIMNDHKAEFQKALEQIGQIMRFRLEEKVRP